MTEQGVCPTEEEMDTEEAIGKLQAVNAELVAALEDIMPSLDRQEAAAGAHCRWCGRTFTPDQGFCDSDDCAGFQARAAIERAKS
jgi:hypothetical protein